MITQLKEYQMEGALQIKAWKGRALLADEMGLGKTLQALFYCYKKKQSRPIVVVCPASLKYNWEREASKHLGMLCDVVEGRKPPKKKPIAIHPIIVINYEILHWWVPFLQSLEVKIVIVDECFPGDALVETDHGKVPIKTIAEDPTKYKVACFNSLSNEQEWRQVIRGYQIQRRTPLVKIHHEHGALVCTKEHKIWVEGEYIEAYKIKPGQKLSILFDAVLRSEILDQPKTILRDAVFSKVESDTAVVSRSIHTGTQRQNKCGEERSKKTGCLDPHETKQPFTQSIGDFEDADDQNQKRNSSRLGWDAGRKRNLHQTTEDLVKTSTKLDSGTLHSYEKEKTASTCIQGRSGSQREKNSHRNRRQRTQHGLAKTKGSKENRALKESRVDRIEILESRNRPGSDGRYVDDQIVYDLEVEEHHNYFADGVLVSNCHMIKNRKSQRYKAVKALCENVPHVIGISGTPLTNNPSELWSILSIVRPDLYGSFFKYAFRYCKPKKLPWGWVYSGARNLDELHENLKKTCMIRRRKKDVLKDLPEKMREMIPIGITNKREYLAAKNNFIEWLGKQDKEKARKAKKSKALVQIGYLLRLVARLKIQFVYEWIDNFLESNDGKLVLFTGHTKMIQLLKERYKKTAVVVNGAVKKIERQRAVDQFQENDDVRIFVGNFKAAGVGLTLTAASSLAFTDLPWTPGDLVQCEDRIHRIGQTNTATIYYLVARDTIEEKTCKLLQAKQLILEGALDGAGNGDNLDVFDDLLKSLT